MKQITLRSTSQCLPKRFCRSADHRRVRLAAIQSHDVATVPAADENSSEVKITFQLNKHVEFGQSICLVGDNDKLGGWDVKNSLSLDWSDGDVWSAACALPAGANLEYKYIIKSGTGKVVWQRGDNLSVQVPAEANVIQIVDDWDGKNRSIDLADGTVNTPILLEEPSATADVVNDAAEEAGIDVATIAEPLLSTSSVAEIEAENQLAKAMDQELAQTRIESLSVEQLKTQLQQRGLPAKGKKEQMVQRLKAAHRTATSMPNNGRTPTAA